jgi:putative Holliday junction resolvase
MEGIIRQFDAGLVVVGMPYNLKGDVGMKATEVERFIQALQKQIDIEIRTWDERFTSTIARQTMIQMGMKKSQRQKKGRVDEIAASLILQSYLDAQGR